VSPALPGCATPSNAVIAGACPAQSGAPPSCAVVWCCARVNDGAFVRRRPLATHTNDRGHTNRRPARRRPLSSVIQPAHRPPPSCAAPSSGRLHTVVRCPPSYPHPVTWSAPAVLCTRRRTYVRACPLHGGGMNLGCRGGAFVLQVSGCAMFGLRVLGDVGRRAALLVSPRC
jgi:hypothetical protein